MLFNSVDFFLFFAAVMLLYGRLGRRGQNRLLLVASYFFYGCWSWRYLGLLFGSSLFDFIASHQIAKAPTRARRRGWLTAALLINFGALFVFKYFDFFVDSAVLVLAHLGIAASPFALRLVLPVGISFLTFQEMGYTIDVYRGVMPPARALEDYLLFVSYFPHLVAGPIQRSSHLLKQLEQPRSPTAEGVYRGAILMGVGLFKKVAVADNLAPYVDAVYAHPAHHSGATLALATYLFAFQIYCDFCGYSDMAVGMARMMGIDLIFNFRTPYLAESVKEFWRRWHISLSTWFRDYLYIPLGGNRAGPGRDAVNVMIVFLLSGLWHGARFTFVVWGALHGLYLVVHRWRGAAPQAGWRRWVSVAVTFHLVVFAWIFFRAASLAEASQVIRGLFRRGPLFWDPLLINGLFALGILVAFELVKEPHQADEWLLERPAWAHLAVGAGVAALIVLFGSQVGAQFIYFQF